MSRHVCYDATVPTRTCLALVVVVALAACTRAPAPAPAAAAAPDAGTTLLTTAFQFDCSRDAKVGCDGLFPIRGPTTPRPPRLAVLKTGEDAFRARARLLDDARRSIRIQALIFRGDEAGLYFADRLKEKKAAGVDVKVIVDALSNLDVDTQSMYFDLKRHGIEVEGYEALYLNWLTADVTPKDPFRPNKRFHDKMWIIDGEDPERARAIVGGLNIANEYFRIDDKPINRWRDQDVLLEGAIVDDVTAAFDRNYDYFKALKERLPKVINPDNSWKLSRAVLGRVARVKLPTWRKRPLKGRIEETLRTPPAFDYVPVTARFLQSRPRFAEDYIKQAYDHLVDGARDRVIIANAYFVPSKAFVERLKAAARRGVHVRILTNSPETNDIGPVATLSRRVYADLLAVNEEPGAAAHVAAGRGLEVWEWGGPAYGEGTLHAKFAVVDEDHAIVGSYNLDPRSERLNSETAVVVRGAAAADALAREVVEVDLPRSRRIGLAEARAFRRPDDLEQQFETLFALPLRDWL